MIYLDNSATTFPKPESVYEKISEISRQAFNAGRGTYKESKQALDIITEARKMVANFINTNEDNVVFTSSATEAMNMIINGIPLIEGDNVYVTPFEHNAVIRTLEAKKVNIIKMPFNGETWEVECEKLCDMFALNRPKAVFVSQISNVTGFELEYGIIFAQSIKYNAINVLDAAQGFGIIKINPKDVNYVVFAGHKSLYGMFGTGGFIKLKDDILIPTKFGGTGSDSLNPNMPDRCPERYEAGSHDVISIAALSEGAKWILKQNAERYEKELSEYLIRGLEKNNKIILFVPGTKKVCGIVSIAVKGYDSNDVASILADEFEICVRSGYHCAPYVHSFIGSEKYNGTVRISMGMFNTKDDIDVLIKALNTL